MSALSDLIATKLPPGKGGRWIAAEATRKGLSIGHATAAHYVKGDHGRPDEGTLEVLAAVLNISMEDLRAAATLPGYVNNAELPPETARLTKRQWRAVVAIIRSMADPEGQEGDGTTDALAALQEQITSDEKKSTGSTVKKSTGTQSAKRA